MSKSQRLHASNISPDISESLEARTKDPLWFLSRQWQFGEFEAETGGAPAQVSISSLEYPIELFKPGLDPDLDSQKMSRPVDLAAPLEAVIEPEEKDGINPAWNLSLIHI